MIHANFKSRLSTAALGVCGVIAWDGIRCRHYPAFAVNRVDTTGTGDIFHGAFVQGWPLEEILEFSSAAAALNRLPPGERGGIPPLKKNEALRRSAARQKPAHSSTQLRQAVRDATTMPEIHL